MQYLKPLQERVINPIALSWKCSKGLSYPFCSFVVEGGPVFLIIQCFLVVGVPAISLCLQKSQVLKIPQKPWHSSLPS